MVSQKVGVVNSHWTKAVYAAAGLGCFFKWEFNARVRRGVSGGSIVIVYELQYLRAIRIRESEH